MRMNLHRAVIGIMAADDHSAAVPNHIESLWNRFRRTARLDDDVHSTTARELPAERLSRIRQLTGGRGADVVIEASDAPEAIPQALDMVRDGGRVIVCGHYTDNGAVEIHPHWQINRKHVELRGCWGARYEHFHRAVELARRFQNQKPWREMVSGRYPLDRAADALSSIEKRTALKAIIVPNAHL